MRFVLFLTLSILFVAQCASIRSDQNAAPVIPEISLNFSHTDLVQNKLQLYFTVKNNLSDTVVILRPYPARSERNFVASAVPPDFFRLNIFPEEALCMYAPINSGTDAVKTPADFMIIEPNGERTFPVNPHHYYQGICDENVTSVTGVLRYQYDNRYVDDEAFFNARIKKPKRLDDAASERLLDLLRRSYRKEIVTDTFTVVL